MTAKDCVYCGAPAHDSCRHEGGAGSPVCPSCGNRDSAWHALGAAGRRYYLSADKAEREALRVLAALRA